MSPAFQETLQGNELLLNSQGESAKRYQSCLPTVSGSKLSR